ncbi:NUDIX hydrolase [Marinicellulosiphila megalodicopiae]|uniref:NUDIX hydrolase n=1 Tax=Marinicellulosiphila megalodicopiae TaxID=2724896 RepID=UPI003BB2216E
MNFCSQCGGKISFIIPADDNRPRHVCNECETIFYQNPRLIVCSIPIYQNKILLCRRGIEPRLGLWTLPGGFMENGETCEQAALRESEEEAKIDIKLEKLASIVCIPNFDQVHLFYLAKLHSPKWELTPESTEIQLFEIDNIPWDNLAFKTVKQCLQHIERHQDNLLAMPLLESSIQT